MDYHLRSSFHILTFITALHAGLDLNLYPALAAFAACAIKLGGKCRPPVPSAPDSCELQHPVGIEMSLGVADKVRECGIQTVCLLKSLGMSVLSYE
jgi:hypothetical protein